MDVDVDDDVDVDVDVGVDVGVDAVWRLLGWLKRTMQAKQQKANQKYCHQIGILLLSFRSKQRFIFHVRSWPIYSHEQQFIACQRASHANPISILSEARRPTSSHLASYELRAAALRRAAKTVYLVALALVCNERCNQRALECGQTNARSMANIANRADANKPELSLR